MGLTFVGCETDGSIPSTTSPASIDAGKESPSSDEDAEVNAHLDAGSDLDASGDDVDAEPDAAPEGVCTGAHISCYTQSSTTCLKYEGCGLEDTCEGVARSCYGRSAYSCSNQKGCYWSNATNSCTGSAWSCEILNGVECGFQEGCRTGSECTGFAETQCYDLSVEDCTSMPGCYVD